MSNLDRRSLLKATLAIFPLAAAVHAVAADDPTGSPLVPAGDDRLGHAYAMRYSTLRVKVATQDTNGGLFIIEHSDLRKGGPERHLHFAQEEWFYPLAGEFVFEVGEERIHMKPGDSICAPRKVPHVWACVGDSPGKMLIAFAPAGKMQSFFDEITQPGAPRPDAAMYRAHEMEMLGPPLKV